MRYVNTAANPRAGLIKRARRVVWGLVLFMAGLIMISQEVEAQNIVGATFPYNGANTTVTITNLTGSVINSGSSTTSWFGDNLCTSGTVRGGSYSIGNPTGPAVAGTFTYNFSPAIASIQLLVTSGDPGDSYTFTTNTPSPIVTLGGTCTSNFTSAVSGNAAIVNYSGSALNRFVLVTISSATSFSSITVGFGGENSGSGFWLDSTPLGAVCNAGTTAPSLSAATINNNCPATTADLSSITASNTPANTTLTWHTSATATTANKVSNPTSVAAGTYYAAFYDATNNCYSGTGTATAQITATTPVCVVAGAGTIDCSKTQITPAPVAGTTSQVDLVVTVNVTTVGSFPLTVSGSGMSLANSITSVSTTKTGIQSFHIPLDYDGTTLSTLNFTVGSAGSCSADLTKAPRQTITDTWTLDCVPTAGPRLK